MAWIYMSVMVSTCRGAVRRLNGDLLSSLDKTRLSTKSGKRTESACSNLRLELMVVGVGVAIVLVAR
jgi:hypothetical protein